MCTVCATLALLAKALIMWARAGVSPGVGGGTDDEPGSAPPTSVPAQPRAAAPVAASPGDAAAPAAPGDAAAPASAVVGRKALL